jgi:hypothetical protein
MARAAANARLNLALTQTSGYAILSPFRWDRDVPPNPTREGVALNRQCSVLIVDRSDETRDILQTVLERRGVRTLAAGKAETGLELARRHHPELIVLDLESWDAGVPPAFCRAGILPVLDEAGKMPALQPEYEPYLVLLGSLRGQRDRLLNGEFVPKPYHYAPLIRRIEELLGGQARPETSLPPELGHAPCRRYSSSAAPIREAASS